LAKQVGSNDAINHSGHTHLHSTHKYIESIKHSRDHRYKNSNIVPTEYNPAFSQIMNNTNWYRI